MMAVPSSKTMLNYFTKLPSKTSAIEEDPRKSAPVFNRQHVEEFQARVEEFDAQLNNNDNSSNYLTCLKTPEYKAFELNKKKLGPTRAKLLQFHEDVRPAYFGTWQKKSKLVTGRKPHGLDEEIFDYDVDSEAEWDIGGPGESLKGDDSEDDEELDDYEIDMKTFVPHGYVSDDEIENSDNEANRSMDDTVCDQENDSNSSVKIVTEVKPQSTVTQQMPPPPKQTPKLDIRPITLGLSFGENTTLSEGKLQFLRAFEGVSCN